MLDIAPNPYADPIKKFFGDLTSIEWKIPFLVQIVHSLITILILTILFFLYLTFGIVSQISTTFWDLIVGMGDRMNFAHPIESIAYAIATIIYFVLFLPFFILQSPIWLGGWFTSKIGFKPFITILTIIIITTLTYLYYPKIGAEAIGKISQIKSTLISEYGTSDSVQTEIMSEEISHNQAK